MKSQTRNRSPRNAVCVGLALGLALIGCRRTTSPERVRATPEEVQTPDAPLDLPAPTTRDADPTPSPAVCPLSELSKRKDRARDAIDRGGALSRKRDWKGAVEAYDVATEELALCEGVEELRARAYAERGFAKLKDGDLDGAEADCALALATSADQSLLGAASYNAGLIAAGLKHDSQAREHFAMSYAYKATAAAKAALKSARIKGRSVGTEIAAERYGSIEAACSALGGADCSSPAKATDALCGPGATIPCVFQSQREESGDWPEPGEGGPYGASAPVFVIDREGVSAVWVYPAGAHTTCWRCGGCGGWSAQVSEAGKMLVATVVGSTGSGTSRHYSGVGPMGCGPGLDVDELAVISRDHHQTAVLVIDAVEGPER